MVNAIANSGVLTSLFALKRNQDALHTSLQWLSTGKRINAGKDDPAGLISSEQLSSALAALQAETDAFRRQDANANIAEGHQVEISGLMNELNGLVVQAANTAGMSDAERGAIQMEIDSAVSSIQRISGDAVASLDGIRLPGNGNADAAGQLNGAVAAAVTLASNGVNSLASGNFVAAQDAIRGAITEVATVRGTIGAYQKYTLQSSIRANEVAIENLTDARSRIVDTDFAVETSNLAKFEILVQSGYQVLKVVQNQQRSILDLFA